jgi:hypothetical protein
MRGVKELYKRPARALLGQGTCIDFACVSSDFSCSTVLCILSMSDEASSRTRWLSFSRDCIFKRSSFIYGGGCTQCKKGLVWGGEASGQIVEGCGAGWKKMGGLSEKWSKSAAERVWRTDTRTDLSLEASAFHLKIILRPLCIHLLVVAGGKKSPAVCRQQARLCGCGVPDRVSSGESRAPTRTGGRDVVRPENWKAGRWRP